MVRSFCVLGRVGWFLPLLVACGSSPDSTGGGPGTNNNGNNNNPPIISGGYADASAPNNGGKHDAGASDSGTQPNGNDDSGTATDANAPTPSGVWVSGYYVGYQQDSYPPSAVDFTSLTHIIVGRVIPNADGSLNTAMDTHNATTMATTLSQGAHAAGKKALLWVGGAGTHSGWVGAASSGTLATFVSNLVQTMTTLGYDGLDLDWEPIQNSDFANFKALATALRQASPHIILSVPVGWQDPVDPFYAQIAPLFDQMNMMSYGMADAWPGWQSWHSSALFGESASTPSSIDRYVKAYAHAGVPSAKVGMGIGFFGSCWSPSVTGPRQDLGSSHVVASDNVMSYTNILSKYFNAQARQWDDVSKVPFLSFGAQTGPQRCTFLSYDDEQSIAEKGKYAHNNGVGGTILWTLAQGYVPTNAAGQQNPLLSAVKTAFLN